MIAEVVLGHGEQAFDYYTRLNPSAREAISEVHRCEPYVYAQMIAGRTRRRTARRRIPGLPARRRGIMSPSRSGFWDPPRFLFVFGFGACHSRRVGRLHRDAALSRRTYHITVRREGPGNVSLRVEGQPVAGTVILPLPAADQTDVIVEAVLR